MNTKHAFRGPWSIGRVEIQNRVVLAPMAGVTNIAFRVIAKRFGAGLIYTEMVSDQGILMKNSRTLIMTTVHPEERPLALQLFGGDAGRLAEAARYIDAHTDADIIDINLGCPAPKINKIEAGAKWLLSPERVYDLYRTVRQAIRKPLTAKIRLGWDDAHRYYLELAQAIEEAGGDAIAVHGRTRAQMYEGQADWRAIAEIKARARIPIIGNGDVRSPEDARRMIEETGVDAVMVGRAALGNPWILYRIARYLEHGERLPEPTAREKIALALEHLDELIKLKGERVGVQEMRKHAAWYLKGLRGASRFKDEAQQAETREEMRRTLLSYEEAECIKTSLA